MILWSYFCCGFLEYFDLLSLGGGVMFRMVYGNCWSILCYK
jgi:hypothetical protein